MILSVLLLLVSLLPAPLSPGDGHLVIVGGGGTPPSVFARALELAGSSKARVLVLPQASRRKEAGVRSVAIFRELGARTAELAAADPEKLREQVKAANLLWMPGGNQTRLMEKLRAAKVVKLIAQRYHNGAVVGGTSAGAAVMSTVVIARGATKDESPGRPAAILSRGLGLWDGAIVDQHFSVRLRFERLLDAVLQHPTKVGIGIDEKTAVIVQGDRFEVMGEKQVLVIDARSARRPPSSTGPGWEGLRLHLLTPKTRFDLKAGKVLP